MHEGEDPLVAVHVVDAKRGRGLVARHNLTAGQTIMRRRADLAVLYSPFANSHCARCYQRIQPSRAGSSTAPVQPSQSYECPNCECFVLCGLCVAVLRQDLPHLPARSDVEVRSKALGEHLISLTIHPLLQTHRLACSWYNELPEAVRAPGEDTDYIRFCFEYGARVAMGDDALVRAVESLDDCRDAQSAEARRFCQTFARDRVLATFGPGTRGPPGMPRFPVDWQQLEGVLLRTRCNSLGFPFTQQETIGWSLEKTVCMMNHSCEPNAAIVADGGHAETAFVGEAQAGALPSTYDSRGSMVVRATRNIAAGEEVTLSYLDLEAYGEDVRERTRHLLEQYRFLCQCPLCNKQRSELRR